MGRRPPRKRLNRPGPEREPYDRVLIVCEGGQTERTYFAELAARYRLSTANIHVVGRGADPRTVVREAKKRSRRERRHGETYDKVYCVFDRDEHETFEQACWEARDSRVIVAASWPCFEFWLRLHFGYSRKPYAKSGGRTAAQTCVDEASRLFLNVLQFSYRKAARGVFAVLEDQLEEAKIHAADALVDARATGQYNPSTGVHQLVDYLQSLNPEEGANGN